ncbi:MAG: glycosyltransferase family 4 protein [Phycisphaerales bacterium]|nr:glycosyltransferase family 4 protein [Phycisphaerales bacterium]
MRILVLGPSDMLHLRRLVTAFVQRGHRVHVVSMRRDPIPGATFERYRVPPFGLRHPHGWTRRRASLVRRWFQEYDVVTVHYLADWGIDRPPLGGARLIVKPYGSDVDPPPGADPLPEKLVAARRRLLEVADLVVTDADLFQDTVARFGRIDAVKMATAPIGVDMEMFAPSPPSSRHCPVIGSHRGFHHASNPLLLIDAAAKVLLMRPDVKFELAGAGVQREACVARAESLGIQHAVRWLGQVDHESLPRVMSDWDIAAIASKRESFCVSALEASAMEIPVVATRVGGLVETVRHQQTGLLVPPDDADSFAHALLTLLADHDLRFRMGAAGRRFVARHFEWTRAVDRWLELFESSLAVAPAPRRESNLV